MRCWFELADGRWNLYEPPRHGIRGRLEDSIAVQRGRTRGERLAPEEIRAVRGAAIGPGAVYFRVDNGSYGRVSTCFAAETEAEAERWFAAFRSGGDLLDLDMPVPGPVPPPPPGGGGGLRAVSVPPLRPPVYTGTLPTPVPWPPRQPSEPVLATNRVLATVAHAWEAKESWQLTCEEGEIVEVERGRDSDGWVEVYSPRNGGRGAIPASYLASTRSDLESARDVTFELEAPPPTTAPPPQSPREEHAALIAAAVAEGLIHRDVANIVDDAAARHGFGAAELEAALQTCG